MGDHFVRAFNLEPALLADDDAPGSDRLQTLRIELHTVPLAEFDLATATNFDDDDLPLGTEQHMYILVDGASRLGQMLTDYSAAFSQMAEGSAGSQLSARQDEAPSIGVARALVAAAPAYKPGASDPSAIVRALDKIEALPGFTGRLQDDGASVRFDAQQFFEATGGIISKLTHEVAQLRGVEVTSIVAALDRQLDAWSDAG